MNLFYKFLQYVIIFINQRFFNNVIQNFTSFLKYTMKGAIDYVYFSSNLIFATIFNKFRIS